MPESSDLWENLNGGEFNINLVDFAINLGIALVLATILRFCYTKWGRSLTNRGEFASNFALLTLTTMLVISVVKSSIALSLGLVGALSIVRFRAAIKEPEELVYLFLAVGIGIGLGADQRLLTIIGVVVALIAIILARCFRGNDSQERLYLTAVLEGTDRPNIDAILASIREHASSAQLKRADESNEATDLTFAVSFKNPDELAACQSALKAMPGFTTSSFVSSPGLE